VTQQYPTTVRGTYHDYVTHTIKEKNVNNEACFAVTSNPGDSGGGNYVPAGGGNILAAGITSLQQASGGTCFTPVNYVGGQLGAHIWTGD
jgi:hypothetical protein